MTVGPYDLNLRHLRAVPLIARRGSMVAAAEAAGISQPALTQGLAKLERLLGAGLFDRGAEGMTPTAAGAAMVARIDAAVAHLARGARSSRRFARPERLMTATQLRSFLALVDAGSFTDAARATGWSQPSIHRAVRELEQVFAEPLLARRGRGVTLTEAGARMARAARLAAAELAAGIVEVQPGAAARGRLVIGAMPLARARLLPAVIARIMREAPHATVEVIEGSWRELVEPLRDGVVDVLVGALRAQEPPGLVQTALFDDRLAVIARAGHPLAHGAADIAALMPYPWIVGAPGSPLRAQWEALFAGADRPAAPILCGSVMTIRGILLDSDGLTLLSPDQVAVEIDAGLLTTIPLPHDAMVRTIGVTVREDWRPTALQTRFLQLLEQANGRHESEK